MQPVFPFCVCLCYVNKALKTTTTKQQKQQKKPLSIQSQIQPQDTILLHFYWADSVLSGFEEKKIQQNDLPL
jgi:hypothetical protein